MKQITVQGYAALCKRVVIAAALLASLLLPALRLAGGPSLAETRVLPETAWACEAPNPSGGCGGG